MFLRHHLLALLGAFLTPLISSNLAAQTTYASRLDREQWVDSVFSSLSPDQRIAQLMVIRAHSNLGSDHVAKVVSQIKQYNVGALCFFQGGPIRQAQLTNQFQQIAQTPLMITIDGEWGLGMRLDSVKKFPYQLSLGALQDEQLVYRMGVAVGQQCKRLGVHVNYAPVVDINNNPNNPVIGFRSFGEDKEKVARFGVAYMKGMQDAGIMACAKHFPGHGDVDVDSHYDLPRILKTRTQLDSLELVPFRAVFQAGIGSVMVAHLSIPSIDPAKNVATSISKNNVTQLLRNDMNYQGLVFTDALEMKGVAKYFPGGTISVEAILAGNDMLCLPADVKESIEVIQKAIKNGQIQQSELDSRVRKVLGAKYDLGLNRRTLIDTTNLLADLNRQTDAIVSEVAEKSITLLNDRTNWFQPRGMRILRRTMQYGKVAYVGVGLSAANDLVRSLGVDSLNTYYLPIKSDSLSADSLLRRFRAAGDYDLVLLGIHNYSNKPMDQFGLSKSVIDLARQLNGSNTITLTFGNVLANAYFCQADHLLACQQDDSLFRLVAASMLRGYIRPKGTLPVRVCDFPVGAGIVPASDPTDWEAKAARLQAIDAIAQEGIREGAFPGCVVMAVHKGEVIWNKAYGFVDVQKTQPTAPESIFDLASVTKISATTVAVMKLYEQGLVKLDSPLSDYLPVVRGTDKGGLIIRDILLHQGGLVPFIPFYKATIDPATGNPLPALYRKDEEPGFQVQVAEDLYLRNDWTDTLMQRIVKSPLGPKGKYVYSDNDFIFLGKIVEQLSGLSLDEYVQQNFYRPLSMYTTGFRPRVRFPLSQITPTESEKHFRQQTLHGHVHDEGASLFGGIAGHAGLFSNAQDLAVLYQMLLQGGTFQGKQYLKSETIQLFTSYQVDGSRRGLGFDKPERDNKTRKDPYPSLLSSPSTFGHTGFTGTCVWVDPLKEIVYIFLSNRVHPTRDNGKLMSLSIRGRIQDVILKSVE
ncbi:MAG: serine hydrolase [Bacteroidetes bacterium]|nr:serine hydrolase [Bacteroidota bacterium]